MSGPAKVKVFGRNGEEELHLKANARDLVANTDGYWSWNPHKAGSPMDSPPFLRIDPPSNKSQADEILERLGTGINRDIAPKPEADGTAAEPLAEETEVASEPEVTPEEDAAPVASEPEAESVQIPETAAKAAKNSTRRRRFDSE